MTRDLTKGEGVVQDWIAVCERAAGVRLAMKAYPELTYLMGMPIRELKRLWDSYDGAETCDPTISGEAVHLALNLRGEGAYCAI